jgi:hypothetical protein
VNGSHSEGRQPGSTYWLIARDHSDRVEVLTIECGGQRALPVFSFEEEAELFLGLGGVGHGWWVRESGAGEIVSMLYGQCADVRSVVLDPLPEMVAEEAVGLVSLSRKRFVEHLVGRGG